MRRLDGPDPVITSAANPRLKALTALHRRRGREASALTLVEGFDELVLVLEAGAVPRTVYYCPELMSGGLDRDRFLQRVRAAGAETVRLGRAAFEKAAYREGPDGVLAVVPAVPDRLTAIELPAHPLVLLCQGIEKPGNLGAMIRTADAAGLDAVVAADSVTDWGNPNVVRASKGSVYAVPVASASTAECLAWLARSRVALVATTPDTDVDYADVDYTGPVAVAVGAEKNGLTGEVLSAAAHRVRIPMVGRSNSLNVATSAAIVLYEAVRQRRPAASQGRKATSQGRKATSQRRQARYGEP
jgi:RNA methyltransferase, TrmH family